MHATGRTLHRRDYDGGCDRSLLQSWHIASPFVAVRGAYYFPLWGDQSPHVSASPPTLAPPSPPPAPCAVNTARSRRRRSCGSGGGWPHETRCLVRVFLLRLFLKEGAAIGADQSRHILFHVVSGVFVLARAAGDTALDRLEQGVKLSLAHPGNTLAVGQLLDPRGSLDLVRLHLIGPCPELREVSVCRALRRDMRRRA